MDSDDSPIIDKLLKESGESSISHGWRLYLVGFVLFYLFLFYGSLTPFEFRSCEPSWGENIHQMLARGATVESKMDWYVNLLLGVPAGFLTLGLFCAGQRPFWTVLLFFPVLAICGLLAFSVECFQLLTPGRNCALSDIMAQTLGSAMGAGVWIVSGQSITDEMSQYSQRVSFRNGYAFFVMGYIFILIATPLFPLDVVYTLEDLYHRIKEGVIYWQPFSQYANELNYNFVYELLSYGLSYIPLGIIAGMNLKGYRENESQKRVFVDKVISSISGFQGAMVWAAFISALSTAGQIFIASRLVCSSNVLIALLFTALGWLGVKLYFVGLGRICGGIGLLVTLIAMIAYYWSPFEFKFDFARLDTIISPISFIPLADYQKSNTISAIYRLMIIGEFSIFVPFFLYYLLEKLRNSFYLNLIFCFLIFVIMEGGQIFLPTRTFTLSDILLQTGISLATLIIIQKINNLSLMTEK